MSILDRPPDEPEGDDTEAAGGSQIAIEPVTEDALEDTEELDEDDVDDE